MNDSRRREGYSKKRSVIVDAAWQLFARHGYELTTVDTIVETADISKGTFYHYFESKEDVLDAVVERMTTVALEKIRKAVHESELSAVQRLNRFFVASRQWRFENIQIVREIIEILYRDENVRLLHKSNERSMEKTAPLLKEIIEQGVEEGIFSTPDSEETAFMILEMLRSAGKRIMAVYKNSSDKELSEACTELARRMNVYPMMIERMLCAESGSLERIDRSVFEHGIQAFRRGLTEEGSVR